MNVKIRIEKIKELGNENKKMLDKYYQRSENKWENECGKIQELDDIFKTLDKLRSLEKRMRVEKSKN